MLSRIAWERDVADVTSYDELDERTIELLKADLLYTAYLSPNVWASQTNAHGSYSKTTGSQSITCKDRERLFDIFIAIYTKYADDKLKELDSASNNLQWL